MKFTEITYKFDGKAFTCVEQEGQYQYGDVTYEKGVINRIESLTRLGAEIIDVFQHN